MSHFFAYISRLKLIKRWSLMRNTARENSQEHSWQVAATAHALAIIKNQLYGGRVDANQAAVLGLYHDVSETITGDLPTPIKYANPAIQDAYHALEAEACKRLETMLPTELQKAYEPVLNQQPSPEQQLVHIADKICAYIKCAEEITAGNQEFAVAYQTLKEKLDEFKTIPEADYFMKHFLPSFHLTLDEMQ